MEHQSDEQACSEAGDATLDEHTPPGAPARHPFHRAQVGSDDHEVLHGEPLVSQIVHGRLSFLIAGESAHQLRVVELKESSWGGGGGHHGSWLRLLNVLWAISRCQV